MTTAGASWALCGSDAVVLQTLCVARESVESKFAHCFFRFSADARAAASAFLFVLDLGAIANRSLLHTVVEKNFSAHMRGSFGDRFITNVTWRQRTGRKLQMLGQRLT